MRDDIARGAACFTSSFFSLAFLIFADSMENMFMNNAVALAILKEYPSIARIATMAVDEPIPARENMKLSKNAAIEMITYFTYCIVMA